MQNILLGLSALMQPQTLLFLFIGTVVGLIIEIGRASCRERVSA